MSKLIVSSSPHFHAKDTTAGIMLDVIIALTPAMIASVIIFGFRAAVIILTTVASCILSEYLSRIVMKRRQTVGDLSCVVTGILLAMNLPVSINPLIAAFGGVVAIVVVKQMFGGIGQNFINPALAARTILMLSWAGLIAATALPAGGQLFGLTTVPVDAVASATPLVSSSYSLWQLFIGDVPGMLGETCKLTLILGGVYLIVRKVIDWRIPVFFIATAFILFWIQTGVIYSVESGTDNALYQILSGGLLLGAFFMATDYVTSPVSKWGKVVMGIGCAVILFVIRAYNNSYPEGCSFAILFMNVLTPLIDKWTMPRTFGAVKPAKAKKSEAKQGGAKA